MVGLKKFMRQYKSDDDNPQIPDEEITELWLETATRGSIYYYESKLENPKLSDADISRNYREELVEIKENVYSNYNHWYADKRIYEDFNRKDYDCGCKPGEKCPTYYRYDYYIEKYSAELDNDHSNRWDHHPYVQVECLAKVRSDKYCKNRSKNKNKVSDMCDTKPACEIPVAGHA
jgi:hypothetical protein